MPNYYLNKLKFLNASLLTVKNIFCFLFFVLQGKAIELSISTNKLPQQLVYTLIGYVIVKLIVMLCDVFQRFISDHYKNLELKRIWIHYFPKKIYKDNDSKHNQLSFLYFNVFPRLFELKISIFSNMVNIICIFTLTLSALIYSKFYLATLALLLVFIFNFISRDLLVDHIGKYHHEENESKTKILKWIGEYLSAYREISKNWVGISDSNWSDKIYENYYLAKKKQTFFYFYRDLISQALVELPFLFNSAIVILGVYYHYVSLTQLFVWIGFCQLMITASNAYIENRVNKKEASILNAKGNEILNEFEVKKRLNKSKINTKSISEVTMLDGQKNILSIKPGIYHIKGNNGSGKTTLLNIILGYERHLNVNKHIQLDNIINSVQPHNIRLIERNAVIFDSLTDFSMQVCGPYNARESLWKNDLINSINILLNEELAKVWIQLFISLEKKYIKRNDKSMSSGEQVLLSLLRFFVSWNKKVKVLIVDECDSFLDKKNRELFIAAIKDISSHLAIFISGHQLQSGGI